MPAGQVRDLDCQTSDDGFIDKNRETAMPAPDERRTSAMGETARSPIERAEISQASSVRAIRCRFSMRGSSIDPRTRWIASWCARANGSRRCESAASQRPRLSRPSHLECGPQIERVWCTRRNSRDRHAKTEPLIRPCGAPSPQGRRKRRTFFLSRNGRGCPQGR